MKIAKRVLTAFGSCVVSLLVDKVGMNIDTAGRNRTRDGNESHPNKSVKEVIALNRIGSELSNVWNSTDCNQSKITSWSSGNSETNLPASFYLEAYCLVRGKAFWNIGERKRWPRIVAHFGNIRFIPNANTMHCMSVNDLSCRGSSGKWRRKDVIVNQGVVEFM